MRKRKAIKKIRLPSKKHSIPLEMVQFHQAFQLMTQDGLVDKVGIGRYRIVGGKASTLEIKGYDDNTSFYNLDVVYGGFVQKFHLKVKPQNKKSFENYLETSLAS